MPVPTRELTDDDRALIEYARVIVDANTDGVDGVHTVGAAVRTADGRMYGGINLYHFTGGPCAELVALGHALDAVRCVVFRWSAPPERQVPKGGVITAVAFHRRPRAGGASLSRRAASRGAGR